MSDITAVDSIVQTIAKFVGVGTDAFMNFKRALILASQFTIFNRWFIRETDVTGSKL